MIGTLGLTGLRIGELMDLRVAQVDLARGRLKLADSKTEAGVREVEITLYLRDELLAYVIRTGAHEGCRFRHPTTSSARPREDGATRIAFVNGF